MLTKEDVKNLSKEEKLQKINELEKTVNNFTSRYNQLKATEQSLKKILASTYGAFANQHFVVSNFFIANSITLHGRDTIVYMIKNIESYFFNEWHLDKELHRKLQTKYIGRDSSGKCYMINVDQNKILGRPHKEDKEKNMTALYSLLREWHIMEYRLETIHPTTTIINDIEITITHKRVIHDFSNITPINGKQTTVRDEENELYFHEVDVLVYSDTDSNYITFQPMMDSCGYNGDDYDAGLEFVLNFDKQFMKEKFNGWLNEYAIPYGVKNLQDFELESINKSALHIMKKNYISNISWEDGIFHEDMTAFFPKGVEIVKSTTPPFVRGAHGEPQTEGIWKFVRYLFENPKNLNIKEVIKIVKDLKKEFINSSIEDIAMTVGMNGYEKNVLDDQECISTAKGCPSNVKSAAFHNYLLNKNSKYKTKYDLIRGGKIKYYYCIHPLAEKFGFLRGAHPNEITEDEKVKVDFDTQFSKTMLSIVNRFLDPVGLPPINKRLTVLNSLIDFITGKGDNVVEETIEEEDEEVDLWDYELK